MKTYERIEHADNVRFRIHNITQQEIFDEGGNIKNVLDHWHPEMEVVFTYVGNAKHYIDGCVYEAAPGKVFVANSESIHKIISDGNIPKETEVIAVVLNIDYEFIQNLIPDMNQMYFLPEVRINLEQIGCIMKQFADYGKRERNLQPYEELKLMSMLYKLMYLLCTGDLVVKEKVLPINSQKNLERLRGIMQYIRTHYTESITQQQVAKRFYFSVEYFSRFFKKNTGMTFKEYLTRYRVAEAKKEILDTDKSILNIAVDHGFSDARGLINAFKKIYGTTPLQYRISNSGNFLAKKSDDDFI